MNRLAVTISILCLLILTIAGCASSPTTTPNTLPEATTETVATAEPVATTLDKNALLVPSTIMWLDVPYADQSKAQKLDIYMPATGNGPFPVIFAIHGGGFGGGDKVQATTVLKMQLDGLNRGYAVVAVNYRLSGEAIFPAAVYDIKAALRFIKANAATYNLNPDKIAAWGDSAGGNLASMLGTSSGIAELEDLKLGNAKQDVKVQAVVDMYGAINFLSMDQQNNFTSSPKSSSSLYLGANVVDVPELVAKADPTTYITAEDSPFYITHGTKDLTVPSQQSVDFAAALTAVIGKDKVTLDFVEGVGHSAPTFGNEENLAKIYAFLDKYLK